MAIPSVTIINDYLTLCKPKVVLLMLVTAWVGMHLATPQLVPTITLIAATIGIASASASAAVINHILDRKIDAKMLRTATRPIADGRITSQQALIFAFLLASIAFWVLYNYVNPLTTILTFATLFSYAIFYTLFLKYATPQNIVIGGAAGAMPPLLGWAAVNGDISAESLLLVMIIFLWTPPHFWALALWRLDDYKKVKIPMLPVTHGINFTKLCILLYSILLIPATTLPYLINMAGRIYLILAMTLNTYFCYIAYRLYRSKTTNATNYMASKLFRFSITYLLLLYTCLLLDHYSYIWQKGRPWQLETLQLIAP